MSRGDLNVTYTVKELVKEIYEKQEELREIQLQTLEQAKRTNGRVTVLEKKSVGLWITNNPIKFVIYVLLFIAFVISDLRQPLFMFLVGLL